MEYSVLEEGIHDITYVHFRRREPIVLLHSGGMTGLVEYEEQAAFFENKIIKLFVLI